MTDLASMIDIYCERTEIGVLNEPLNTITNLSFFIAAGLLFQFYRDRDSHDKSAKNLIIIIALVGIGSSMFHMFADTLTMIADIIPILIFVFYYLWVALQRFLHWERMKTAFALIIFAGAGLILNETPDALSLNHSIMYLPCLGAIIFIGLKLKKIHHEFSERFLIAATIFSVSLFFRIVDNALCGLLPIGTHFMWHVLNGVVVYQLTKAIIEKPPLTLKN